MVYISGDLHGDFDRIASFCYEHHTCYDDIMIVLGDVGLNYNLGVQDRWLKTIVSSLPITFLFIHGNHERRPETIIGYKSKVWNEGVVFVEDSFPRLLFAKDGSIFRFSNTNYLVVGGAYSVDKFYRLSQGRSWFPDEQPSPEIKMNVEHVIDNIKYKVDTVLTHTCPKKYMPMEALLPGIDQSTIDNSTEDWLDSIEDRLEYKKWYCGHFHINKTIDKMRFIFDDIVTLE